MKRSQLFVILLSGLILASFSTSKKTGIKLAKKTLDNFCEFIPSGNSVVEGDTVSVQSFYMSSSEISNLQYQEFLDDLLRKGELGKYNIAKVDSTGWTRDNNLIYVESMQNYYHKHPAYDNYPVVNISKAGAELYCEWLTEVYDSLSNGEMKLKFRLPLRSEWIRAASGDLLGATYSWGGPYLRNNKGCMLANFLKMGSENIRRNPETGEMEVIRTGYLSSFDHTDITAPTKSYFQNDYGLYNMNGNVSEMIADGDFAVGGDWYSPGYDIRNESIKEFNRPEPTVGFRVVTTFLGREIER
ncbi:MAG: SUMF1/EgtB/PvdO family nonheme iron enzyme [Crocinitomicaceae bacterium]|nr:SUMF1/EgtB/PvdO family nonheme iron enzyme [Crocinitomicaceae bacterium]